MTTSHPQVDRLIGVMHALRSGCPWDAEQTHLSLVHYLVEETGELVEAIENGDDADLLEELGDLMLQVLFHAEIAAEAGRFDIEDVAARIADKLIARHPYVFGEAEVPDDLIGSWERRKKLEKGRTSALDGIPERLSALARAHKVIGRARSQGHPPEELGVEPADLEPSRLGEEFLRLVATAEALGVDPEQEARQALRDLEDRLRRLEAEQPQG
ncbi:MAG: MazG family protein [Propionicimonas sp.]|uniref:MazG family protein n=1 Tax=Propionicimonas sp. TaxID=1955623 RepID=UPI002B21B96C|nr:MazG family protein [Propionicimonas sp.]MEA4943473.1 MazG family protein [Propionicimonas sp.]MEA5051933.1 MazG family protein [Propionicimonas sp.]MEA5118332.1 MazG family protein [Propionicimonas sp.]